MKLRLLFSLWALFLVALAALLTLFFGDVRSVKFLVAEGCMLLLLLFLAYFYQKVLKPMRTIGNGMDLLREQDFSSRLSPVGQYDADRLVNLFNRMMDQLKSERLRLREQNQFLDLLIQASPMGVVILTFDEEIQQLNPMALKQLGVSQERLLGRKLNEVRESPLALQLAQMEKESTDVIRLNDANIYKCSSSYFLDNGFHHPFFLIERMTDELFRAEKKAYEKVIRMIAHEVNNSVAGITSALDTVNQTLEGEQGMEDLCQMMEVCSDRCLSMSRFITRFADVVKIPAPVKQPVDLNELVCRCKQFMEGTCHQADIELHLQCDERVSEVSVDAALMEQVLVNILKNAVESISSAPPTVTSKGCILISTTAPACIEVSDNGPGIPSEVANKLFTPFFSTKPNGQGIGLVFIREVLLRHDCQFSLNTDADGITRFRIRFKV